MRDGAEQTDGQLLEAVLRQRDGLALEGRLYLGRLYIFGLLDFLVAILLSLRPPLAPLIFTLWNSTVLVWMALYMPQRSRLYTEAGQARLGGIESSHGAGNVTGCCLLARIKILEALVRRHASCKGRCVDGGWESGGKTDDESIGGMDDVS